MIVCVIEIKLDACWVKSLKEKRMIVKSICARLRNKFNVAVNESAAQDWQQTIVISIAYLADSNAVADSIQEQITGFVEQVTDAQVIQIESLRY